MSLLIAKLKDDNIPYEIVESKSHPDRSPIRSYDSICGCPEYRLVKLLDGD